MLLTDCPHIAQDTCKTARRNPQGTLHQACHTHQASGLPHTPVNWLLTMSGMPATKCEQSSVLECAFVTSEVADTHCLLATQCYMTSRLMHLLESCAHSASPSISEERSDLSDASSTCTQLTPRSTRSVDKMPHTDPHPLPAHSQACTHRLEDTCRHTRRQCLTGLWTLAGSHFLSNKPNWRPFSASSLSDRSAASEEDNLAAICSASSAACRRAQSFVHSLIDSFVDWFIR